MENLDQLRALGLFDSRVPRYTSYPTAPVFSPAVGAEFQAECLEGLDPAKPVSVYVHIPFCERLCWFCACRTQGTRTLSPVERYLDTIEAELAQVAAHLPRGVRMGRLHWGGGTPTILPPELIHRLSQSLKAAIRPAEDFEFSVEIDPTMVDDAKIAALGAEGMTRASIGIQDFRDKVQKAIGREQSFEATDRCVRALRAAGIASLNTDLVYGLPHQTVETVRASVDKVLSLSPDRVALFGYAHVPHMSKRQTLIDEAALPGDLERHQLFRAASGMFRAAGLDPVGIDHFARPDDGLATAMRAGRLRRNFQGYTEDTCGTLIGIGASSISRFAGGYVQNAAATGAYTQRIGAGTLAGYRGHSLTETDKLHARAIEMLMCDFRIDMAALRAEFADSDALEPIHATVAGKFPGMVAREGRDLRIRDEGRPLTRIIAAEYDEFRSIGATYSRAS
ncbi:oxygen-independent coproporphyrinogen-3 oxidase [Palleronia marisminoris]|uniref:Coproporphyrinogen-III oxidase n=1 Tax=Palleronia marisminoris TaxID=315423 RepID=A0A1Y5RMN0_9RHOB|nr:oxygen-independent coproporphyrinogen III oxidase [Palleronia marisminoris]SFG26018.1 oxygen-independent coproporphyrinogen-3 oxidase [Palleronia marisminoris]SLN20025.1 Oxygen-independent coproporphyrinogen-III oxidase [Palleronia marisminoris]